MDIVLASPSREVISTYPLFRHPVTTFWLWMMVTLNVLFGVFLLSTLFFGSGIIFTQLVTPLAAFLTAVGAYWLLRWKKRGFYLVAGGLMVHLLLSIMTRDPFVILRGIANLTTSLGLLYMVLQIGNGNKPWNHLN